MNKKILITTVGGTPNPLVISVTNENFKADLVYFIHSKSTKKIVEEIVKEVPFDFNYKTIEINNPEDLNESYKKSIEAIKESDENNEIRIDFTGGTKVMVAGLILASSEIKDKVEYVYIGSKNNQSRDKSGIGRVITGNEKIKPQRIK